MTRGAVSGGATCVAASVDRVCPVRLRVVCGLVGVPRKGAGVGEDPAVVLRALVAQLRAARRGLRLTQEGLGGALGVSALAVGSWETGKDVAGLSNLVRWAQAVGFTVGVEGAAPKVVLVPGRDEPWSDFHIRCLMGALAGARERAYCSQEMVGDAVGVSAWTVHMWETAHRVPRVPRLITWCQYLSVGIVLEPRHRAVI